jgi:CheY-like chemotaxis protein
MIKKELLKEISILQQRIRDMLAELLMAIGYDVETANDGLAAIDLYIKSRDSRQPYKMVILDLTVPQGLGGKPTMERLLAIDPDVNCIILSGYTNDSVIQNYQQYGFWGALTKPFTLKALQNILEKYL